MKRTIASRDLRPGMFLHKLCGSWLQHPFWRSSFLIEDMGTVQAIIDSGIDAAVIDLDRGDDVPDPATVEAAAEAATETPTESDDSAERAEDRFRAEQSQADRQRQAPVREPTVAVPLSEELRNARRVCLESKEAVQAMFQEARLGRTLRSEAALPVVEQITGSVLRNSSALISIARLKTADDYTYLHSVAVCAMMVSLAIQLGMNEDEVREAGVGGLLHDMGKALMPLDILNKPGRLTDEEFVAVRKHPRDGHDMLVAGGVTDAGALDIALHHHEKIDGSGYPDKLAGEGISRLARMGAVCDVYDAITSNRPYKRGWDPAESMRQMLSWKGHFDEMILRAFIRSLGIYPVGALVRLESEKLAVVVEQTPGNLLLPKVKAFYSARLRTQVMVKLIDLAEAGCQERIVRPEDPAAWGFRDLDRLWAP